MKYPRLFEKGSIGTMTIRNRTVMPAMGTNLANETGGVSQAMVHYYRARAKGGVGLIITELVSVDSPGGYAIPKQLDLHSNTFIAGHNELVEAVHEHGAKIVPQLHHAGRQTTTENTRGLQPVAPSAIPDPYLQIIPRELTLSEIEDIIDKFVQGAIRAQKAGYDGVEIHGAHGYLVAQFMSPSSNRRTDMYGGDTAGRMGFPTEIVRRIKKETKGNFPVIFRYSGDEFIQGGINLEEAKLMAKILEEAGADALHISSGTYASMHTILEPMNYPEAWRAYLAEQIKKVVGIPVITVGNIRSPQVAENLLNEEKADFIALGRTLIADPEWPLKVMLDRDEDIRKCITCNLGCISERVFKNLHIRCTVNPVAGREIEYPSIPFSYNSKHFVVVGGGPAGMEAARVLAEAGNKVSLIERESELGGQIRIAAVPPGKDKIRWSIEYLETQIRSLGVDIQLKTEATAEILQGMDADCFVIATGAAPIIPSIKGVNSPNVTTAWEILAGQYEAGGKVIVVGGGSVGCETALYLRLKGIEVTVLEMEETLADDMEPITRTVFLEEMGNLQIQAFTGYKVQRIEINGVVVLDKNWREHWFPCDHVVLSMGAGPINHLEDQLKQKGLKVAVIGDAKKPRKLREAISEGFMAAHELIKNTTYPNLRHQFTVEEVFHRGEYRSILQ
ncbi:MAG: FAD-dependent oxidoreductase [Clostridia bacterium]|nr:FAD-dependent oxidoreductase [Clostridia bacterium]